MLYQRRMRLPHVEDPTLNGTPLERMMLSLTSAFVETNVAVADDEPLSIFSDISMLPI